jgi:diguanylate cyclase (GGDEF)-like protein
MNHRSRLLIVDDIAQNRDILSRRFLRCGFEVVEAEDGDSALALLDQQKFDLVLLDIMMPGIDGFEVLRRIRAEHSRGSLPVIMVTARAEGEDVEQAIALGANDYITKPVGFSVALARVEGQIARKRVEEALSGALQQLEERVVERTGALFQANQRLEEQIAEGARATAEIRELIQHDPLTGAATRVSFREHLHRTLARVRRHGERVAVLLLNLDRFKSVNETLGRPAGDLLLKQVAERLRACSRDTDTVARLGGDEFAIIQAALRTPEDASALALRIVNALQRPFDLDGHQVVIGASIGLSTAPGDGLDPDQLLSNADLALDRAKADGRNTYRFFEPEMNERAQARRQLELDLRKALANGEFELHYQPLVSLETNEITGFEALIRWQHPERGMIPPGDFIPLAEETGLIVPIGEWVLARACSDAANWPGGVRVAVNLSPAQFKSRSLVEAVHEALTKADLPASRLELEITESVLLISNEGTMAALHQLLDLGVHISMDDFGTGYSSLSYLRSFPFDKIKIDRSFVRDLGSHQDCAAIVRAVAGLGASLGMATTAEGVETQEQLEKLRAEGCTEVQGFLLSRPQPASEALRMLTAVAKPAQTLAKA